MEEQRVLIEHEDGAVRTLRLNRPKALNSFTGAMHVELAAALEAAANDAGVRCIVLTGSGRGFCAGQDLADPAVAPNLEPGGKPTDVGAAIERYYKPLALRVRSMPVPVIAAVNGVAAGAGANLALCCDLVVAARSASFIQAFAKIGLIPDCGGTWLLPRLVGRARAMGLALLGDKLAAEDAERIGLIWKCIDDAAFESEVRTLALGWRRHADRQATGRCARALHRRCAGSRFPPPRSATRLTCSAFSARRTTTSKASPPSWPSARPSSPIGEAMGTSPTPDPAAVAAHMFAADGASRGLGMRITQVGEGTATLTMTVRDDMLNGHDICHGGFITTLADSAFAFACNSRNVVTVAPRASSVDFLAPAQRGDVLTATASETSRTGRTGVYDMVVVNQHGARVALVRGRSHSMSGRTVLPEPAQEAT